MSKGDNFLSFAFIKSKFKMKKFILPVLIIISTLTLGQVKVFRTSHLNIGFGKYADVANNKHMEFCVNGPLVGTDGVPVGGFIDNDSVRKNWTDPVLGGGNFAVENHIFGQTKNGKLFMIPYSAKDSLSSMKWAIQNGPVLVKNGINARRSGASTTKYQRSGIGYTRQGEIVVIISILPVTFREFAEFFVQEDCVNAVFLDGGPTYVGYADKLKKYGFQQEAMKIQFFNN